MSKGKTTRDNILTVAFNLASENGLESLTIGELAKQCSMSKSGVFAHFNSKDNLQIAVLEYANQVFTKRVIAPARLAYNGSYEHKLRALLSSWLDWNDFFQGSCMFLDAWKDNALEQQKPTQQALKQAVESWLEYLSIQIQQGINKGEYQTKLDAKQATFELYGLYLSAHLYYSIHGKTTSRDRFWQGIERLIASWK